MFNAKRFGGMNDRKEDFLNYFSKDGIISIFLSVMKSFSGFDFHIGKHE